MEGYSKLAIGAALSIYLLTIPLVTGGIMAILRWLKRPRAAGWVFATIGSLLVILVINLVLRRIQWQFDLRAAGITDSIFAGLSVPLAIGCAWLYRRFEWSRQLLSIAAIGIVLFPLNLLSTPAMRAELLGFSPKTVTRARAENPVPIVFIAFDGLCAMSLLDEHHEIDAVRSIRHSQSSDSRANSIATPHRFIAVRLKRCPQFLRDSFPMQPGPPPLKVTTRKTCFV